MKPLMPGTTMVAIIIWLLTWRLYYVAPYSFAFLFFGAATVPTWKDSVVHDYQNENKHSHSHGRKVCD